MATKAERRKQRWAASGGQGALDAAKAQSRAQAELLQRRDFATDATSYRVALRQRRTPVPPRRIIVSSLVRYR